MEDSVPRLIASSSWSTSMGRSGAIEPIVTIMYVLGCGVLQGISNTVRVPRRQKSKDKKTEEKEKTRGSRHYNPEFYILHMVDMTELRLD